MAGAAMPSQWWGAFVGYTGSVGTTGSTGFTGLSRISCIPTSPSYYEMPHCGKALQSKMNAVMPTVGLYCSEEAPISQEVLQHAPHMCP